MPEPLDRPAIERIVHAVADNLDGDWLLIGGALVSLWLDSRRMTADIDIVGISGGQADRFALMGLAEELGIPIETMNSAADFFVQKVPGWKDECRSAVDAARVGGLGLDEERIEGWVSRLPATDDPALAERRSRLLTLLDG